MKKTSLLFISFLLIYSALQAQNLPPYVPTDSLLGWWSLDGNAQDASTHQNHGTVNGATPDTSRHGFPFTAMRFNGLSDFIQGTILGCDFTDNTTVSAWVKFTGDAGGQSVDSYFQLGAFGQHTLNYSYSYPGQNLELHSACFDNIFFDANLNNEWHHLVIIDSNAETYIYIDGVQVLDTTFLLPDSCYQGSNDFFIGGGFDNQFVTGYIDDVGLWNRALEPLEVLHLFQACDSVISLALPVYKEQWWGLNDTLVVSSPYPYATFQWQFADYPDYPNFTNISATSSEYIGANNDTLIYQMHDLTDGFYRCIVTNWACSDTTNECHSVWLINSLNNEQFQALSVSPNPFNRFVDLKLNSNSTVHEPIRYTVADIWGRQVGEGQLSLPNSRIFFEDLSPGVYFLIFADSRFKPVQLLKQ
jgi:hypothetical protein